MPDFITDYLGERSLIDIALALASVLAIIVVGYVIAKLLRRSVRQGRLGAKLDPTLRPVLSSALYYLLLAVVLYAALIQLGVPATSLLAVFGAAGLAVGLALKDTLANIASGIMLLTLRPLEIGEYVETPDFQGSVVEIGLFATTLRNKEAVVIYVPNAQVWSGRIINYTREETRKFIVEVGVGYTTDLKAAVALAEKTMAEFPDVLMEPTPPEAFVAKFGDSAITLDCRCWMPNTDWLKRSSQLRITLKDALDDGKIEIPFPQRVVRQIKD